jgi:hypothetical protein
MTFSIKSENIAIMHLHDLLYHWSFSIAIQEDIP